MQLRQILVDLRCLCNCLIFSLSQDTLSLYQDLHIGQLFVKIEDALVFLSDIVHELGQSLDLIFLVSDSPLLLDLELVSQAINFLCRFALIVLVADV